MYDCAVHMLQLIFFLFLTANILFCLPSMNTCGAALLLQSAKSCCRIGMQNGKMLCCAL